ncbi:MAG: hypothetical protein AB3N18_01510 [Allomuricauda sp.]
MFVISLEKNMIKTTNNTVVGTEIINAKTTSMLSDQYAWSVKIQLIKKKANEIIDTATKRNSFLELDFLGWNIVDIHIRAPKERRDISNPKLYKREDNHPKPKKSPSRSLSPR